MYHRILPAGQSIQPGMYVSPVTFEKHLVFIDRYLKPLFLKDMLKEHPFYTTNDDRKPPCMLTFDDGWKDFYDFAFPLLKKYNIPATVFIPTSFIGTNRNFWTDIIPYLINNRKMTAMDRLLNKDMCDSVRFIDGLNGSFDYLHEKIIAYLKKYPLKKIEKIIAGLTEVWNVNIDDRTRSFLNWPEINEMLDSGLVSFGSHTVNHQILTTLNESEIIDELVDSKNKLLQNEVMDSSFISFCYPNGNHNKKIVSLVRSSGYHIAVTTNKGWNHFDDDKFTLKRVGIHEDMASSTAQFACRITELI